MKKYLNVYIAIVFSFLLVFLASTNVYATTAGVKSVDDSNISYPIGELGSCKDKADCANFCSKSENMVACMNFAEKQGLLKGEDLRISKIVAEKISKGQTPGQCKDQDSCEKFCKGKVENIDACIAFAEELNILPESELAQAKNVAKAMKEGAKLPGSCKSKDECENYCEDGNHIDECLVFAEAANILPADELKEAKKVAAFLKNGETPGKCKSKKECDNYCKEEDHGDECLNFAEKAGFISKEEAEIARKVGGAGPGGCKGKDECEKYCEDENHADECANFAVEKGLVDDKTKGLMKNGIDQMKQSLDGMPAEVRSVVEECLNSKIGRDKFQKILNKEVSPTKNQGESIQSCFAGIEAKMKALMMKKAGSQGEGEGFGAPEGMGPSKEDIENMQRGAPDEEDLKKMIPGGIPGGIQMGGPSGTSPQIDCGNFSSVPSCSYVPEAVRAQCEKCKE